ncbi:aryl-sulfate sulfotransferase [Sphingomonas tabacisoli]|uniref:Aryl-sulfate sulfotransferase n=1 Tax=Sphingomonas tabacisoli TaxID=2249466 RepID=A0ABW4I0K7_9SPHN
MTGNASRSARLAIMVGSLLAPAPGLSMPTVYPTGVTINDKIAAYPCDVIFSGADDKTYLLDPSGKVIKTWAMAGVPAAMVDPALVGGRKGIVGFAIEDVDHSQMPRVEGIDLVPGRRPGKVNKTFGLVDWNGKVVWQWSGPRDVGAALQHHDWSKLPNGNFLILSNSTREDKRFTRGRIVDDVIYEVDRQGAVVWQWNATDHLDEFGFTPEQLKLIYSSVGADYLHVNAMSALGANHWEKAGDRRFAADNIIISSRNANVVAIVDRRSGHIVWRIGPVAGSPAGLGHGGPQALPRPVDQTSGQHDPHMIPEGMPGAGNILIFDNQGDAGYPSVQRAVISGSRIIEIDPSKKTIVWEYKAGMSGRPDPTFFSPFISSAQRLPNGNTLIDEGINGRIFQVTREGRIVWEYISPYEGAAPQPPAPGHPAAKANLIYRAMAVPPAWVPSQ